MKGDTQVIDVLRGIPLFKGLSDKSLKSVASQMKQYDFSPGSAVVEEKTEGKLGRMYVVLEGSADVKVGDQTVASYGPGDHFGEMSVLDGGPRSASVVATSGLVTMGLSSWNLRSLVKEEPEIGIHLIEVLTARLREANAKLGQ